MAEKAKRRIKWRGMPVRSVNVQRKPMRITVKENATQTDRPLVVKLTYADNHTTVDTQN